MAHPLELAEPNVIDEELTRSCITTVEEMSIQEDRKQEMKTETELHHVQALSFSFQNILKIDNLNGLFALVKLQLDNNIIEKIENISHLTNLEWLDLSFNNISKIEGLESLLKLTDLSLFNNRVEKLTGLDTLTDLNCLSMGNNSINDLLSSLQYLRSFGNLRILNMQGNPCSRDPDYHTRVIAHLAQRGDQGKSGHLSDLVYLDYKLVDPEKVQLAKEQWQDELYEEQEKEVRRAEDAQKLVAAHLKLRQLQEANLEGVDTLLRDMLDNDPEQLRLKTMSFWDEVMEEMRMEFKALQESFIASSLDKEGTLTQKSHEFARFVEALEAQGNTFDLHSIGLVRAFDSKKKLLVRVLEEEQLKEDEGVSKLKVLLRDNIALNDDLLELQVRQMDADDAIMTHFQHAYEVLVKSFIDTAQTKFFGKVRELENAFFDKVVSAAQTELEEFGAGKLDDVSDAAKMFLMDKDIVMTALSSSHDAHLGSIDGLQDKICTNEKRQANSIYIKFRDASTQRDRNRITEIGKLTTKNNDEINRLVMDEEGGSGFR
eukprot:CAMPEP_0179463752 /NCGR_PEP_ID=MMETSP0799-20121207/45724_1 /TAXON_ID=46947 /ORGANISM="Geminigera cryophila, Strain CCMP2564" /LENGTH=544 /DNA_ID=CAMNT_0021267161 /DNA_START=12 /DNA_END=1646 /DNA_ORIENTATION=-